MAESSLYTVGSKIPLAVHLLDRGVPVPGAVVSVELRRLRDGRYLDWAAPAAPFWKTSGGVKEQPLPEKSWKTGLYQVMWDQSVYDIAAESYTAVYRVTSPVVLDNVEFITFSMEWGVDVEFILKLLKNKSILETVTEQEATHTWYDDDNASEILKHRIREIGNQEIREPE